MITQLVAVTAAVAIAERRSGRLGSSTFAGRPQALLTRNGLAVRTNNALVFLTGFVEPVIYLIAFGYGVGGLIGSVEVGGQTVPYAAFIAPALLASSAMNGALMDATFNVFFKMHFMKLYEVMMSTSLGPLDVALGEISWAMIRGATYAVGFTIVAGAVRPPDHAVGRADDPGRGARGVRLRGCRHDVDVVHEERSSR